MKNSGVGKLYPNASGPNQCNYYDMMANGTASILENYESFVAENDSQKDEFYRNGSIHEESSEKIEYLHIILTGGSDVCSKATIKDVFKLNHIMRKNIKLYQTAYIRYMAKGND